MVNLKLGTSADSETNISGTSTTASASMFSFSSSMPKRSKSSNQNRQTTRCQVQGCNLDLASAKDYHRRHKICEPHSKSPKVIVAGLERRFCQQCSRFHSLSEFDDMKRSCRRRLSDHNARRRRPYPELPSSGFSPTTHNRRPQNVFFKNMPASASNATWENFCCFRMGQARNPLMSPSVYTDVKQHFPPRHLNMSGGTSATTSDFNKAPAFPHALSLLSNSSCGLSGTEPCSPEKIMQGHNNTTKPVMQLESQNWPTISSEHLQKEQVASTSSMDTMDFHCTDDSFNFQDFLSFKTSYEPNIYRSS